MTKSKKNNNKPKLNLTVREEQRNKLEQMASLENRSVSNLIEVMADERWKRLAEQQGVAYAKTVAEAMKLKLDMDNPADRAKLRRAVLDLVAGRKMPKEKRLGWNSPVLFLTGILSARAEKIISPSRDHDKKHRDVVLRKLERIHGAFGATGHMEKPAGQRPGTCA